MGTIKKCSHFFFAYLKNNFYLCINKKLKT